MTNCHVLEGANLIYVKRGKLSSEAEIRFQDPERDLCQLSINNRSGFQKAITSVISVSELRVGQKVYAIGAPQGFDLTLSDGLISSLRTIEDIGTVIQTNAPMSPGSSGGGLFDNSGRLIGITSFQFNRGQNLNFAIPAEWILELPSRYVEHEEVKHKAEQKVAEAEQKRLEAARREEEKKAELEKRRLEEEQRNVAEEKKRAEAEQKRAEAEQMRIEVEQKKAEEGLPKEEAALRADEQKRAEEERLMGEAKRADERAQRAATAQRESQQQEAVSTQGRLLRG